MNIDSNLSNEDQVPWASWAYTIMLHLSRRALGLVDDVLVLLLMVVLVGTVCCCVALWRNKYVAALKVQAVRKIQAGKPMNQEDKKFKTAMQAETLVENMLKEEGWQYVFPNRRVAVSRVGHNREIDIIAVGPRILVVEVKHWRGWVWSSGSCWYQKPHKKAQTLEFENVYSDNVEKAAALRRFIENAQRIPLPDATHVSTNVSGENLSKSTAQCVEASPLISESDSQSFHTSRNSTLASITNTGTWYSDRSLHTQCGLVVVPVVVFTNKEVILDPDTILKMDRVFTLDTFRTYLRSLKWEQQRSSGWRCRIHAALPFLHRFFCHESHTSTSCRIPKSCPSNASRVETSGKTPVFLSVKTERRVAHVVDMLRTWDVLHLHDGRIITGDVQSVTAPTAFCAYERKHLLNIKIQWNTGWLGLILTFLTNKSASVELELAAAKRLAIKKKENKPRNKKGNIEFPIRPRQRKVTGSDRLEIRAAGNTTPLTIALADVKEIFLSKHLYITEKIIEA